MNDTFRYGWNTNPIHACEASVSVSALKNCSILSRLQGPTAALSTTAAAGGKRDSLLEAPSTPQSGSRRNSETVIQGAMAIATATTHMSASSDSPTPKGPQAAATSAEAQNLHAELRPPMKQG